MDSPRECECHGVVMYWHKMNDRPSGGLWRCRVRHRENDQRYASTDKAAERVARYEAQPHRQLAKQINDMTRVRIAY